MTDLSPAADAVLDAYMANCGWLDGPMAKDYRCTAAVLRAAADQVVPDEPNPGESQFWDDEADQEWQNNQHFRNQLLAIAAELEAKQ